MSGEEQLKIVPEATPNPNCVRFGLNRTLASGPGCEYDSQAAAANSPLARDLLLLPGVRSVFVGPDFVTVGAAPGLNWWALKPMVTQTLAQHIASGQPAIETGAESQPKDLSPLEASILKVIEDEIQPAVAQDGGMVLYAGYDNGVVKLRMRGACQSCPRALFTLKMGIEHRLKQMFPEIQSVEAV